MFDHFNDMQRQRISLMSAIAIGLTDAYPQNPVVLKGGTALLLSYGLNRFSEDMDFDVARGTEIDLPKTIDRVAGKVGLADYSLSIKKDTETTKRYMLHYGASRDERTAQAYPLKIEISARREEIPKQEYAKKEGIFVYEIGALAYLKALAFADREKARDIYDINFLLRHYPRALNPETLAIIAGHIEKRGVDAIFENFQAEKELDPILQKIDGAEIALELAQGIENAQNMN